MAKHPLQISCEEYAATMHPGWGEWRAKRDPQYVYLHCGSRLCVIEEQHSHAGFGYDRMDALAELGISDAALDAQETADQIVERILPNLSLHQLRVIIPRLQQVMAEWEAEREQARLDYEAKYALKKGDDAV